MPQCQIIYDKFHILQHAATAVDEVRRAEFFRKGGRGREIVKGKRWLLLSSWVLLDRKNGRQLNQLFALNRRVMKAYLLWPGPHRLSQWGEYRESGTTTEQLSIAMGVVPLPAMLIAWRILDFKRQNPGSQEEGQDSGV